MELQRINRADPALAKLVVAALVSFVVLCLLVLLLLVALGDVVVHS